MNGDVTPRSDQEFLDAVRSTLGEFVTAQPMQATTDTRQIQFPSASLDANGTSRFAMRLPESLICSDLGAANIFYDDIAGRGFEFPLRRFLDLHLVSDDVFIDVGAHFGVHSLTAATILPRQVSVLAIEPHPQNFATLQSWVELNQLQGDILTIPKAISDRESLLPMWVSGSSMGHSLRTAGHEAGSSSFDVGVTTLDTLIDEHPRLQWRRVILKIDVEGCEPEVLDGARRLFATANTSAVIWEKATFHEQLVQGQRDSAVFQFLDAHGFEHFHMETGHDGVRLAPVANRKMEGNIYSLAGDFTRKERYG